MKNPAVISGLVSLACMLFLGCQTTPAGEPTSDYCDGHKICSVSLFPEQSKKNKNICPKCKKQLVIGVLNRVEELADRPKGFISKKAIPYKKNISLKGIIAEAIGFSINSEKVKKHYDNLIEKLESEFNILLNSTKKEIEEASLSKIADGVIRSREGKISIIPGYDGVYGKIDIF